jgi:hypothetical protein
VHADASPAYHPRAPRHRALLEKILLDPGAARFHERAGILHHEGFQSPPAHRIHDPAVFRDCHARPLFARCRASGFDDRRDDEALPLLEEPNDRFVEGEGHEDAAYLPNAALF